MTEEIHSCSYYCHKDECIRRQRDELRDTLEDRVHDSYFRGWNTALERASRKFESEFEHAFGRDTVASFGIWLRQQKEIG